MLEAVSQHKMKRECVYGSSPIYCLIKIGMHCIIRLANKEYGIDKPMPPRSKEAGPHGGVKMQGLMQIPKWLKKLLAHILEYQN